VAKRRRRRRRRRSRRGFDPKVLLAPLLLIAIIAGLLWKGDDLFQRPVYRGPQSLLVYVIDTSGSQDLPFADREALDSDRKARIKARLQVVGESEGVLLLTSFASEATGVRQVLVDLSDKAIGCRTVAGDGSSDERCSALRMRKIDKFVERGLQDFVDSVVPTGRTDVVNAAFGQGASIASTSTLVSASAPRSLSIESDFIETACPSFADDISRDIQTAVAALAACATTSIDLAVLREIELVPLRLSTGVDLADIGRASETFLEFCKFLHGECHKGS